MRDPIDKGAQLLVRGANAVGLAPDSEVSRVDSGIQQANNEYLYRSGRNESELDIPRLGGNVVATSAVLPARLLRGTTALQRAGGGAAIGAAGGALQPVFSGDFAEETAKGAVLGAVAGGVGAPVTEALVRVAVPVVNTAAGLIRRAGNAIRPPQVDNLISQALEQQGIAWRTLSDDARAALREDVTSALRAGGDVDPAAIRRLSDLRAVGATPTRGAVSLDPVQITRERNLAKVGANSEDPNLQTLAQVENANNRALIDRLNTLGASRGGDPYQAGEQVIGALRRFDDAAKSRVTKLYDEARQLGGGDIPLDGAAFVNQASRALDANMRGAFLPAEFRNVLQDIASGKVPMTISTQEQLRTMLATAQRGSRDGNTSAALGIVRDALENAQPMQSVSRAVGPAVPGARGNTATPDEVNRAFTAARQAHRARMKLQEETPALAAALDNEAPDQFVRKFVLSDSGKANARDLAALSAVLRTDQQASTAVRSEVLNHLKRVALNQATDEVGTFSQSAFNRELSRIGEQKLRAIGFSADDISQLRQVGRAASYLQIQPKGSAVNNSNTASAVIGTLDSLLQRLPYVGQIARQPLNSMVNSSTARNALRSTLPVTGADIIDEPTRNALLRLSVPFGGALGMAGAQ
jgi:hypothetical protein